MAKINGKERAQSFSCKI